MLFEHRCDIKRYAPAGTNGRHDRTVAVTDVHCLVIPLSSRSEIEAGLLPGSGFDIYMPLGTDIQQTDQVIWQGKKFNIRHVREYDVPRVGYTHATATREAS